MVGVERFELSNLSVPNRALCQAELHPAGMNSTARYAERVKELLDTLDAWRADGVRVGRAMVIQTYGSAPRAAGASLLYASDGRIAGSVSGGCVEGAAAEEIARAFETGA